ncbi:MAG: sugar transferase [Micrococcales bacterium]|nr:sugar transferase [Micrococcales bacterium]
MAPFADDYGVGTASLADRERASERRAPSREPRRSWASPQPFVARETVDDTQRRRWREVAPSYVRSTILGDLVLAFTITVALTWRFGWVSLAFGAIAGASFVTLVAASRGYLRKSLGSASVEFEAALRAVVLLGLGMMAVGFTMQLEVPRRLLFVGLPLLWVLSWVARHSRRRRLHRARERGEAMQPTLVVGDTSDVSRLVAKLHGSPYHGFEPVAVCLPDPETCDEVGGIKVVGGLADIVQVAVDRHVEVVVVSMSTLSGDAMRRLSWALGRAHADLVVAPDLVEVAGPRLTLRPAAGVSLLDVEVETPRRRLLMKSAMDRGLALIGSVVALPVIAVAALAVVATSPGGAFFRQTRVGLDGKTFTMWKLRTMYADAEERKQKLLDRSEGAGLLFKMREDPRVTPVGRLLRRTSLDELPQLWNIVRGDMSLVGPRPPLAEEVAAYPDHVGRRLHVRPGLTGLWQVSGRSDLDWDASVALDLRYVDNWSVSMDLMILWKTGRAVLKGHGAY